MSVSRPCPRCGAHISSIVCPYCSAAGLADDATSGRPQPGDPAPSTPDLSRSLSETSFHHSTAQRSPARIVVGVIVVAAVAGAAFLFLRPGTADEAAATNTGIGAPAANPTSMRSTESTPTLSETMQAVVEDPYRPPTPASGAVNVMASADGRACDNAGQPEGFGGYPAAACKTWQAASGLTTGAALSARELVVSCQADLELDNPVFTENQENTWWFWAQADDGTWDWFPETALSQGASMQPTNGIAVCDR